MKFLFSLSFMFLSFVVSAQSGQIFISEIGFTQKGKKARAVMHGKMTMDEKFTYFDLKNGYSIVLKNDNREEFALIVSDYLLYDQDSMEKVDLGSFTVHAVTCVAEQRKILDSTRFESTYQQDVTIDVSFDGEDLWIHIPKTQFLRFTSAPTDIRIFKDYVETFFKSLVWKRKK